MKKILVLTIMGMALLAPVIAAATSITGSVQGFNSVSQVSQGGKNVHIPAHVAATETAFVVVDAASAGKHYLIQNVDRAVLARLVNQQVRIDGELNAATESIAAKDLFAQASDKSWQKVWAVDTGDPIYRNTLGSHPLLSGN